MVGKTLYHVHEALVAKASKFFANALKSQWRTDPSAPIELSDENDKTFEAFMQWLYTANIPIQYETPELNSKLAEFYVLGEKLQAITFQNAVLVAIITGLQKHNKWPGTYSIRTIYRGTPPRSPARRLMADMCTSSIHSKAQRLEDLDPGRDGEFMKDLITSMTKCRAKPKEHESRPWIANQDAYLLNTEEG